MNKGFIHYFVLASLLFHLLVLLGLRHIPWQQARLVEKDKEPIAIDLVGPLKKGEQTQIPKFPEKPPEKGPAVVDAKPRKDTPKEPMMTARAAPVRPEAPPAPPVKPAPASPPPAPARQTPVAKDVPRPEPPAQKAPEQAEIPAKAVPTAKPGDTAHEPDTLARARPRAETPSEAPRPQTSPASPGLPGSDNAPRRLVQPSVEDLMRYAKVDKQVKRVEPEQGITLDTTDLMYTSYLQGLRRRIQMVWRYPDTAQQDGLQGELVMRFAIEKSGRVESIELLKSSGYPVLDRAAEKALSDASPFNPLPDSWEKERFVITGTFIYKLYGLYMR